jgi:hypothetical protein
MNNRHLTTFIAVCLAIVATLFTSNDASALNAAKVRTPAWFEQAEKDDDERISRDEAPNKEVLDDVDNHKGFSTWMAGGGVKGGLRYGATDEFGYEAIDKRVHIHDWHATILHLLGLDHERLTFPHAGRDMRLTDVKGNVHLDLVA